MAGFRGSPAPASRRPQKPDGDAARVMVPFEDNRVLTRLLGEFDSHLALIEDRLGIDAHAHGNVVILTGQAAACALARDVLEKLYTRVTKGETVGAGDFDGLIRHARSEGPASDGQAQVATRRRVVKARTLMQSAYIRAIEKLDLVCVTLDGPRCLTSMRGCRRSIASSAVVAPTRSISSAVMRLRVVG